VSEERRVMLQVKGDDRLAPLPAAFSNFVQVSRVSTEVQFEFLFVDIGSVASAIDGAKKSLDPDPVQLVGIPVAKVVVPALNLMQIRDQMNQIFDGIEKELGRLPRVKEANANDGS
jgi:hypothetical protein